MLHPCGECYATLLCLLGRVAVSAVPYCCLFAGTSNSMGSSQVARQSVMSLLFKPTRKILDIKIHERSK